MGKTNQCSYFVSNYQQLVKFHLIPVVQCCLRFTDICSFSQSNAICEHYLLYSLHSSLFFCLSVVTYDMQCRVMKHIHTRMNSLKATVQSTQNTYAHTINYISVSHHHMHNISSHRSLYYINKLILSPLEHVLFDIEKIQQFDALYASVCARVRLHVWYNVHCTFCRLIRLFWDVS